MKRDLEYQNAFGKHLKSLRETRGWTQVDLAVVSGVSEIQISKLENGEDAANIHTIKNLALSLGFYPKDLLDFEFDLSPNSNFTSNTKGPQRVGTTEAINELLVGSFFKVPRSVSSVIEKCKEQFDVLLVSASVSGALRKLVDSKILKRIPSGTRGSFLYQKR